MTAAGASPRAVLPGFAHIGRYWDAQLRRPAAKILPGEYYVSACGELIVTVLGSCVAACARDPATGFGGMNHFMLPDEGRSGATDLGLATRYGTYAMESLINEILKHGGRRDRLEVKLFGGGHVLDGMSDVGQSNIRFARRWLAVEGLAAVADDTGGAHPRKVYYDPATGRVRVKYLKVLRNDTITRRELAYRRRLASGAVEGSVDLF
jgi:chemotaxis protein CheD